jgi:hypothetical protein
MVLSAPSFALGLTWRNRYLPPELIDLQSVYNEVLIVRIPKALMALVMALALFAQASSSCVCAIGCLLATCNSEPAGSTHHQDQGSDKACHDDVKRPSGDHDVGQNLNGGSAPDDSCECPTLASGDLVVLTTVITNLTSVPSFHTIALLPERLEVPISLPQVQEPGHYGNDSGPPASRPNYISLGRAPPVLLA